MSESSVKVLFVDDSEIVRLEICGAFRKAGFEVVSAVDGNDGIEKAKSEGPFPLVFSDYNMPGMNGIDMIETIKSMDGFENSFFAMLTTESSKPLKQKGKEIGVGLWAVKPIAPDKLIDISHKILERMKVA